MSRLKHPVRAIREPFGKAGLTVAILALVMAMVGGAYAAGKLTSGQKKEVEKIAKKFAGKPGSNGSNGSNGAPGAKGENGTNGVSVTTSAASNTECPTAGGVKLKAANEESHICNGKEGAKGTQGPPGPFVQTLPSGNTLKGVWDLPVEETLEFNGAASHLFASETFAFPLSQHPTAHYIGVESGQPAPTPPGCLGTVENPGAEPGNLCVFATRENGVEMHVCTSEEFGSTSCGEGGLNGFLLVAVPSQLHAIDGSGTWAVTAE